MNQNQFKDKIEKDLSEVKDDLEKLLSKDDATALKNKAILRL